MNSSGPNSWWTSKKVYLTTIGTAAISLLTYLAVNDPSEQRRLCYGAAGVLLTALFGSHVQAEAKIDAAAVQKNVPDTTITNTNVEKPDV